MIMGFYESARLYLSSCASCAHEPSWLSALFSMVSYIIQQLNMNVDATCLSSHTIK